MVFGLSYLRPSRWSQKVPQMQQKSRGEHCNGEEKEE